jgi:hypothetical protein
MQEEAVTRRFYLGEIYHDNKGFSSLIFFSPSSPAFLSSCLPVRILP